MEKPVIDQMVMYAAMRSGRKNPSLKLNTIEKAELKGEKLDYLECNVYKTYLDKPQFVTFYK